VLFFITKKECLYWTALAESLYIIQRILVYMKVLPWCRRLVFELGALDAFFRC